MFSEQEKGKISFSVGRKPKISEFSRFSYVYDTRDKAAAFSTIQMSNWHIWNWCNVFKKEIFSYRILMHGSHDPGFRNDG